MTHPFLAEARVKIENMDNTILFADSHFFLCQDTEPSQVISVCSITNNNHLIAAIIQT